MFTFTWSSSFFVESLIAWQHLDMDPLHLSQTASLATLDMCGILVHTTALMYSSFSLPREAVLFFLPP